MIPQLIARIDTPRALVGRLIHQLLTDIGRYHPQVRLLTLLLMLFHKTELSPDPVLMISLVRGDKLLFGSVFPSRL